MKFNWYRLAQEKVLYIMRGVSGAGKSTKARNLPGVIPENIFATDDLIADNLEDYNAFFDRMEETDDFSPLIEKQNQLIGMIKDAMREGRSPLVLDNMSIEAWKSKEIVQAAIKNGYRVEFIDIGTGGFTVEELVARNKHGVDAEMMQRMIDAYEAEGPLTIEKVLESEQPEKIR